MFTGRCTLSSCSHAESGSSQKQLFDDSLKFHRFWANRTIPELDLPDSSPVKSLCVYGVCVPVCDDVCVPVCDDVCVPVCDDVYLFPPAFCFVLLPSVTPHVAIISFSHVAHTKCNLNSLHMASQTASLFRKTESSTEIICAMGTGRRLRSWYPKAHTHLPVRPEF